MKYEDILPIIVLLIYVALVFAKHRKLKPGSQKKGPVKGVPTAAPGVEAHPPASPKAHSPKPAPGKAGTGPRPSSPRLFSLIWKRVARFFAEIERQFRMELERARTQGLEPEDNGELLFDYHEEAMAPEPEPGEPLPEPEPDWVEHPLLREEPGRYPHDRRRTPRCSRYVPDRSRFRQKIRDAVVWSEILAPPLGIRQGKRPWEL